jgi:hypothetical protein
VDTAESSGLSRPPDEDDLVRLARELNRRGARYVVIGGVDFEEAAGGIEVEVLQGEPIPFAGPELMLKLKRGLREKDVTDRGFVHYVIEQRRKQRDAAQPGERG